MLLSEGVKTPGTAFRTSTGPPDEDANKSRLKLGTVGLRQQAKIVLSTAGAALEKGIVSTRFSQTTSCWGTEAVPASLKLKA